MHAAGECLVAFLDLLRLVASRRRQVIITKYYSAAEAGRFRHLWDADRVRAAPSMHVRYGRLRPCPLPYSNSCMSDTPGYGPVPYPIQIRLIWGSEQGILDLLPYFDL